LLKWILISELSLCCLFTKYGW